MAAAIVTFAASAATIVTFAASAANHQAQRRFL
jgi:hypothetical protein